MKTTFVPFVMALVAGAFTAAEARSGAKQPNIIIVMTDDQGFGDFSCHGNPIVKTPHLDKWHAKSVRFVDFHSAPMCTPSRGQIMTGTKR